MGSHTWGRRNRGAPDFDSLERGRRARFVSGGNKVYQKLQSCLSFSIFENCKAKMDISQGRQEIHAFYLRGTPERQGKMLSIQR